MYLWMHLCWIGGKAKANKHRTDDYIIHCHKTHDEKNDRQCVRRRNMHTIQIFNACLLAVLLLLLLLLLLLWRSLYPIESCEKSKWRNIKRKKMFRLFGCFAAYRTQISKQKTKPRTNHHRLCRQQSVAESRRANTAQHTHSYTQWTTETQLSSKQSVRVNEWIFSRRAADWTSIEPNSSSKFLVMHHSHNLNTQQL